MDLTKQANQDHAVGDVVDIAQGIGNIFKDAKTRKIAKEAQAISDKGNYWNLTSTAKNLIEIPYYIMQQVQGKGITAEAVKSLPKKPVGTPLEEIIAELQFRSGTSTSEVVAGQQAEKLAQGQDMKKFIPYILGAFVIGMIIYFISKK